MKLVPNTKEVFQALTQCPLMAQGIANTQIKHFSVNQVLLYCSSVDLRILWLSVYSFYGCQSTVYSSAFRLLRMLSLSTSGTLGHASEGTGLT